MATMILVHEVTIMDNYLLQALHDSLCDIMATDVPFGDKVLVFSGDFCQTLPIVKGASRAGIVSKCINTCSSVVSRSFSAKIKSMWTWGSPCF